MMKALVKYGNKNGQVEIRDVKEPVIGDSDVLLEVKSAGICGWDIEMWRHKMAYPVEVPVIQGHEFCGIVKETGRDVTCFNAGDRVVSETAAEICGKCPQCLTGNYHVCSSRKGFGYGVDGAFTDFVRVPERCLHHIPENVGFDHAALTEPASVAYQALSVMSDIIPGRPVLIIGPGPVGLFSLQIASICGAGRIILAGTSRSGYRFTVAEKLGADLMVDVTNEDSMEVLTGAADGEGYHLVVDAAGNSRALEMALDMVAPLGQITKIGWGPEPVDISLDPLLKKAARLQGTFSHTWHTWEAVLALMSQGKFDMEAMITKRIELNDWYDTFGEIEEGSIVKAVIRFNR